MIHCLKRFVVENKHLKINIKKKRKLFAEGQIKSKDRANFHQAELNQGKLSPGKYPPLRYPKAKL